MQNRSRNSDFLKKAGNMLILVAVFFIAVFLSRRHAGMTANFLRPGSLELYFLLFLCLAWAGGARAFQLYSDARIRSLGGELLALGRKMLLHFFLATVVLFVAKSHVLSRFFLFTYFGLLLVSLTLWNLVVIWLQMRVRRDGRRLGSVLVIGGGKTARSFCATIAANPHFDLRVRGYVADEPAKGPGSLHLGVIDDLPRVLESQAVDDVVIALPNGGMDRLGAIVGACEKFPIRVHIIPDLQRILGMSYRVSRFGPFPIITLRSNSLERSSWRFLKRAFDLVFSLALFIAVFSWLWPLLALLIKATSPGPVFFKQERWGKKNRRILCWKFRSMAPDSTDVDENGRYLQATRDDPRVTPIGRFLRRSNLDELPQFINVLKGEMSLVGPRPHPTPMNLEAKGSIPHYPLRHLVKPGITGWAQVNGLRGETSDPELLRRRVEADIWYIENWSFLLDMKIIGLTVCEMFKGDPHAY